MKISLISLLALFFIVEMALADGHSSGRPSGGAGAAGSVIIIADGQKQIRIQPGPEPATMLAPVKVEERNKKNVCISVCSSWGQECRQGGSYTDFTLRKCRRTCTSASEECL